MEKMTAFQSKLLKLLLQQNHYFFGSLIPLYLENQICQFFSQKKIRFFLVPLDLSL